MLAFNRRPVFVAAKGLLHPPGRGFTKAEVEALDRGIDEALSGGAFTSPPTIPPASKGRRVSPKGIALMHNFEGCVLDAYPDPGSDDGNPWTIGRGATGPGIHKGVRWTQADADARFDRDIVAFAAKVDALVGNSFTDQSMFDALTSFAYNVGTEALRKSTVLRKHKAGDHAGAAAAFGMWVKNDGRVMKGLVRRRAAEAALYLADG